MGPTTQLRTGLLDSVTTIQGRLVSLRPISREDYPTLFRWRSSFDDIHVLNFRRRAATFEDFLRELESLLAGGAILLLVRRAREGSAIGYAIGHGVNQWDGHMGVGLYIEPRFRVRGYGGEAALLWTDFLFRTFPIRRLTTEIYEFAQDTLGIVRAMGAEEVGFMPEHFWHDDRFWGVHYMMLDRETWIASRERFGDIVNIQHRFHEAVDREAVTRLDGSRHGTDATVTQVD